MFPKLAICVGIINNVPNEKENVQTDNLKKTVYDEVKAKYNIETLKDNPTVRAYRDFYWKLGIDPTKTRPSGEALLRRVLHGDELPQISTVVDAYNLASLKTIIPISGFDIDCVKPPLQVRFARNGATFIGIGMKNATALTDKMLVLTDEVHVLCIYPYRDADATKIALQTRNVLIVGYGTPEISEQQLTETVETALSFISFAAGGQIQTVEIFSSMSEKK
jgi:DNA/RNA-binding domain of Phe-tRNA-synthetase-like protein